MIIYHANNRTNSVKKRIRNAFVSLVGIAILLSSPSSLTITRA